MDLLRNISQISIIDFLIGAAVVAAIWLFNYISASSKDKMKKKAKSDFEKEVIAVMNFIDEKTEHSAFSQTFEKDVLKLIKKIETIVSDNSEIPDTNFLFFWSKYIETHKNYLDILKSSLNKKDGEIKKAAAEKLHNDFERKLKKGLFNIRKNENDQVKKAGTIDVSDIKNILDHPQKN